MHFLFNVIPYVATFLNDAYNKHLQVVKLFVTSVIGTTVQLSLLISLWGYRRAGASMSDQTAAELFKDTGAFGFRIPSTAVLHKCSL